MRGAMKKSNEKSISYGATTKQLSEAGITRIVMPGTMDRNDWKARALAYRDIIERARKVNTRFGEHAAQIILDEIDKMESV
jgi:2-methylisocitrate lyase-like PEP mutase family enzyme